MNETVAPLFPQDLEPTPDATIEVPPDVPMEAEFEVEFVPEPEPEPVIEPAPAREPTPPQPLLNPQTLPLALSFTWCPTVGEYLEQHAPAGSPLHRRLREVRLTSEVQRVLVAFPDTLHLLAVAPEVLPDCTGVVPLWIRLAEGCPRAELRFAGESELAAVERMLGDDSMLQLDSFDLPQLLVFDDEWRPVANWGPRPHAADPLLDEWLAQHPAYELLSEAAATELLGDPVDPAALQAAQGQSVQTAFAALNQQLMLQMRIWYNSGLDAEASNELQAMLAGLHDEIEAVDGDV